MIANESVLSINQVTVNAFASAVRTMLAKSVDLINANIKHLAAISDDEERKNMIIDMLGLNEDDKTKVIKAVKTTKGETQNKGKGKESKKDKGMPVPFWIYNDANGEKVSTVKQELCHGLTAGLYAQCQNKPKSGNIYCTTCLKSCVEGIPKRGTIEMREEQFEDNKYEYTPPNGKAKKIYPLEYALSKNYTENDFDDMLSKNGIHLNIKDMQKIKLMPEKKPRKGKGKKLTEDMKNNTNEKENDEEIADDDDDNYSVATTTLDDETIVNDDDDVDDDETFTKNKSSVLSVEDSVATYKTVSIDDVRYAMLKNISVKEADEFDIYQVVDFKNKHNFTVNANLYGRYNKYNEELTLAKDL